jgi:hypothetical protein
MTAIQTGTSGWLSIELQIVSSNAAARQYVVRVVAAVTNNNSATFAYGVGWSVSPGPGAGSGTFDINGAQSFNVFVSDFTVQLDAAGNALTFSRTFYMDDTGTSGMGGPSAVSTSITLPALKVAPNTPTGMTATRVSDTQTKLAWSQTNASNGSPTSVLIQSSVNGGAFTDLVSLGPSTTVTVSTAENRKTTYRVRSANSAGTTAFSAASAPIYTTPAAPTDVVAAKDSGLNIVVSFTPHAAYTEHEHEVWHGTVAGGVTTWDATALATLASGTASYTHNAPDASKVHVYEVRAKAGALLSNYSVSNSVQLLAPPNKPTLPSVPTFADRATNFPVVWVHNPIDTTPQTAYEFGTSTDGGTTWQSTGKVPSTTSIRTIVGNTYPANTVLTIRVRTWGSATTGGSDGTGGSPWSDLKSITLKTKPTTTIASPANGSTVNESELRATLTFAQPEGASFVLAQLLLSQNGQVVESLYSTVLVGITFETKVQNGLSYEIAAQVQDSNGLWSSLVSNTFNVVYLAPVPAVVGTTYLPDTGFGQLDVVVVAPVAGQAEAETVTITRSIDGSPEEDIVRDYPVAPSMTFLDTTPTIHGTNTYRVTTTSADGATSTVVQDLVTTECRRAYLSKGPGFNSVGVFGANLSVSESLSVASDTVEAAGRVKPIGLYGTESSVQLKVQSFIFENFGSTISELRNVLLIPGPACYRDSSGRRVFGTTKGSVSYKKTTRGDLSFTLTETS